MLSSPTTLTILLSVLIFPSLVPAATRSAMSTRAISRNEYSKAHSLGDQYKFDPRDGWQTVNATDLQYKYRRDVHVDPTDIKEMGIETKAGKKESPPAQGLGDTIGGVISSVWKEIKGIGKPEPVTITWYTGHDLMNPSCWKNTNWAPSDTSFGCALTLEGWNNRPKCFQFLELCNGPKKCVFVRVIDTCAGCARTSHHVDLTRAAFGQLADFDKGKLMVQMRPATKPKTWHLDLWGPQN